MYKFVVSRSGVRIRDAGSLVVKVINSIFDYILYIRTLFLVSGNRFMFLNKPSYLSVSAKFRAFTSRKPTFVARLYLKGIGYKFLRSRALSKFIRVELGYSVLTYVSIPDTVQLFNKRNRVVIFGFNKKSVADFSMLFFQLREADAYKGKGVRFAIKEYSTFKSGKQRL